MNPSNIYSSFPLRVATFNIRNTTDRYEERKALIFDSVKEMNPDIIGFQEVSWTKVNQPLFLQQAVEPRRSTVTRAPLQEPMHSVSKADYEVNGDLTLVTSETRNGGVQLKVIDNATLLLSNERVVQRTLVRVMLSETMDVLQQPHYLWIANTHLHDGSKRKDFNRRMAQVKRAMKWLEEAEHLRVANKETPALGFIFVGDFNANCCYPTYRYMKKKGWISAYKSVHGEEPETTFPTGLIAPTMDMDPDIGCIDFIWIKSNRIKAKEAGLGATKRKKDDKTIYASDHFAVWADLEINVSDLTQ